MHNINIRKFLKQDRLALRKLCCDVADRGNPIENIFFDRELAADFLTQYYTDFEPQSTFVAESEGEMVGYITGCLDNRRWGLALIFIIIPLLIAKSFKRGVFFRQDFWSLASGVLRNWPSAMSWRKNSFHSHIGHLHIGIKQGFRHQQVGQKLIKSLEDYCLAHEAFELSASVHEDNTAAVHFFEQSGFVLRQKSAMMIRKGQNWERYHSLSYVKTIQAH